jgi:hypothetical protein
MSTTAARTEPPGHCAASPPQPLPARQRLTDVHQLDDEPALWAAAPMRDGVRDLHDWPDSTRLRVINHYLPLARRRVRRHADTLACCLPADEIDSQTTVWLIEALCDYDPSMGVPFASYLAVSLPHRIFELARSGGSGRYVNDSETALSRARARCVAEHQHEPTQAEITAALGGDPASAGRRLRAVAVRRGLRRPIELDSIDAAAVAVHADGALWVYGGGEDLDQPEVSVMARDAQRAASEALAHSAWHGDGIPGDRDNTRGLWMFVFTELHGHSKRAVATAAGCSPRTVTTHIDALLTGTRQRLAQEAS